MYVVTAQQILVILLESLFCTFILLFKLECVSTLTLFKIVKYNNNNNKKKKKKNQQQQQHHSVL